MSPKRPVNRIKTAFSASHVQMPQMGHDGVMGGVMAHFVAGAARFGMVSALAIGLVLGMGNMAHADQTASTPKGGKIVLAALTATVPSDKAAQPQLFGAAEQRYTDLSAFTKWTGVLERFKTDFPKNMDQKEVRDWMKFIASVKGKDKSEQVKAVNDYMNRVAFVDDSKNYGASDYWATPMEFLARGGDCEDYAVAKYLTLRALGFTKEEMRLAIVYDNEMKMPHAVLVVYQDNDAHILDNQAEDIRVSSKLATRYKPIYSISQIAWWRH